MCNLTMAMSVIQITNIAMYHCMTSVKNATSDGWKIRQVFLVLLINPEMENRCAVPVPWELSSCQ